MVPNPEQVPMIPATVGEEMVERAAKALYDHSNSLETVEEMLPVARAVLLAALNIPDSPTPTTPLAEERAEPNPPMTEPTDKREWHLDCENYVWHAAAIHPDHYDKTVPKLVVVPKSRAESAERERDRHQRESFGWEQSAQKASSILAAAEAEVQRLREELSDAADALSDAASIMWADRCDPRECHFADDAARLARQALTTSDNRTDDG